MQNPNPLTQVLPESLKPKAQEKPTVGNPGTFETLHKECKDTFAVQYLIDGCKVAFNKGVSQHMQTSHTIGLGSTSQPHSYHFGATYMGNNPQDPNPILVSDIDTDGNMLAQIINRWSDAFMTKIQTNNQGQQWMLQMETEYKGSDFTANLKAINPDIVNETGAFVASYLQSMTPSLSLGAEILYRYGNKLEESQINFAGRYKADNWIASGNISQTGVVQATYHHKVNNKVSFAAEFETSLATKESIVTVGYQYDLRQATVRGQIDTGYVIAAVLESKIAPGLSFLLTGMLDHTKDQARFGMGLQMG
eukprot:Nk52_evm12s2657 gene=Nk52_evmTU12s2657